MQIWRLAWNKNITRSHKTRFLWPANTQRNWSARHGYVSVWQGCIIRTRQIYIVINWESGTYNWQRFLDFCNIRVTSCKKRFFAHEWIICGLRRPRSESNAVCYYVNKILFCRTADSADPRLDMHSLIWKLHCLHMSEGPFLHDASPM